MSFKSKVSKSQGKCPGNKAFFQKGGAIPVDKPPHAAYRCENQENPLSVSSKRNNKQTPPAAATRHRIYAGDKTLAGARLGK